MSNHPNSLKNLTSAWNSDTAKDAQKLGVAKRKANKLAREEMKMSMSDWKEYQSVLTDNDLSSVDVLKVLMHKHLMNEDWDAAADLAKTLAEFEKPKLARIEQHVEEVRADDMSDEELQARIKAALSDKS